MRWETPLDLPKLGQRQYLHGTTIFNAMLEVCDQHLAPAWLDDAVVSTFKLVRESLTNGKVVVSDAPVHALDASATLVAQSPTRRVLAYFVEEGRACERQPYHEDQYYRVIRIGADFDGEFVLPGNHPRADFIRGVVGANKLVHQKAQCFQVEPKKIRFLYLKGLDGRCLPPVCPEYQLAISNLLVQKHPSEVWTINRVMVAAGGARSEFRICYSTSEQGG